MTFSTTAAKSIIVIKSMVEKMEDRSYSARLRNDADITAEILNALKWNVQIANDAVKVEFEYGWITLDGLLKWNYQKLTVANSIKNKQGLKGLTNTIKITPLSAEEVEKECIENALNRNSSIGTRNITVAISGHKIILSGKVISWHEKTEVAKTPFNIPDIVDIDHKLLIEEDTLFI
jgi:osmotically-inducible protein OsmY